MPAYDNKKIARDVFETVYNAGKVELAGQFHAPNFVLNTPTVPAEGRGPDVAKNYATMLRTVCPDLKFTFNDQIAEGEKVVNYLTVTGTPEKEFLGLPPSHKKLSLPAIVIMQFENGKIAEAFLLWDAFGFLRNSGVLETLRAPELAIR